MSAPRFAAATLGLALALRLALGAARGGPSGWYAVFDPELPLAGGSEYLPALPALDFGARFFLDTFAQVGASLTPHAVGHPPGLLLAMHALGVDTPKGLAALTISLGALSAPLVYVLARKLLEEERARMATLLYVFAPSALLYGASSADALYATVGGAAAIALLARRQRLRVAVGAPLLAVASFFSWALLALGAWATVLVARRDGLLRAGALAGACAVAIGVFYALLFLATGFDPFGALRSAEIVYREGIAGTRPYWFWVLGSPSAFLVALGLPTAWYAVRALAAGEAVALGLAAVLVVAAVLGFTKAETERIYLFLVPLACVGAASLLPARRLTPVLAALAVQALAAELLLYTVW